MYAYRVHLSEYLKGTSIASDRVDFIALALDPDLEAEIEKVPV